MALRAGRGINRAAGAQNHSLDAEDGGADQSKAVKRPVLRPFRHPRTKLPAAGGFDITAAVETYLSTMAPAQRARSDAHFEGGYWLLLDFLSTIIAIWLLLHFRLAAQMRNLAERLTQDTASLPASSSPLAGEVRAIPFAARPHFVLA